MLILNLRRLDHGPLRVAGAIAPEDPLWEGSGVELSAPLSVAAVAEGSAGRAVWIRGSLSGWVRAVCRRCLVPLELEVREEFGLLFDCKIRESEGDLTLYALDPTADELDLRFPLRERLLLVVPAFPLCQENCRGLCPLCGVDLNQETCSCEVAEPDPRWAPLRALRGGS